MPRAIKIGDKVQAFLNPGVIGEVVDIFSSSTKIWTSGGAPASSYSICRVRIFKTGEVVDVPKSDLFITDY